MSVFVDTFQLDLARRNRVRAGAVAGADGQRAEALARRAERDRVGGAVGTEAVELVGPWFDVSVVQVLQSVETSIGSE